MIELVIFDCDGTLVDSERLGAAVLTGYAMDLGIELQATDYWRRLRGRTMAATIEILEAISGRPLPRGFPAELRRRLAECFERDLQAMPGVRQALEALPNPLCVASNAPPAKIELCLRTTGLAAYFGDRIFSACSLGVFKPAPGLFLHAAQTLGVPHHRCAVVEDSPPGVEAGIAAGMKVFAFDPCGNWEVEHNEVTVFHHMDQLPPLLRGPR